MIQADHEAEFFHEMAEQAHLEAESGCEMWGMPIFQQATLNSALTEQHRAGGLSLVFVYASREPDDHTLALMAGDKVIARFTIHATVNSIRAEADKYLLEVQ